MLKEKPQEVCDKFIEGYFEENSISKVLSETEYCSIVTAATCFCKSTFKSLIKLETMKRIVFITDVHGCYEVFKLIYDKYYKDDVLFVILGDLIDRGDSSAEIFAVVLSMMIVYKNIIYLRGNHETQSIQTNCGRDKETLSFWIYWNYHDDMKKWNPFESYEKCELLKKIYNFFGQLPYVLYVDGVFCIHGGLVKGFKKIDDYNTLKRVREIYDCKKELQAVWNDPLPRWTKRFKNNSDRGPRIKFFGKKATQEFKKKNKELQLILKGHTRFFRRSSSEAEEINGFYKCHDDVVLTFESCFNVEKYIDEQDQTKGCVVIKEGKKISLDTFYKKVYKEYNSEGQIDPEYIEGGNNEKWFINEGVHFIDLT